MSKWLPARRNNDDVATIDNLPPSLLAVRAAWLEMGQRLIEPATGLEGITGLRVSPGVRGGNLGEGGVLGMHCILMVNPDLWADIAMSGKLTYQLPMVVAMAAAYRAVTDVMQRYPQLRFLPNEPLTLVRSPVPLAQVDVHIYQNAVTVPPRFIAGSFDPQILRGTSEEEAGQRIYDAHSPWGRVLLEADVFDPDDADHEHWLNIIVLPDKPLDGHGKMDDFDLAVAAQCSQPGWNLLDGDPAEYVPSLRELLEVMADNGHWVR